LAAHPKVGVLDAPAITAEQDLSLDPKSGSSEGGAIPDASEDADGDGIPNAVEVALGTDPAVADSNGDGVPDGQIDTDGDGLTNAEEVSLHLDPASAESSAGQPDAALDSDGDGYSDGFETGAGSDSMNAASTPMITTIATAMRSRSITSTEMLGGTAARSVSSTRSG
jgi:hypothetical protein